MAVVGNVVAAVVLVVTGMPRQAQAARVPGQREGEGRASRVAPSSRLSMGSTPRTPRCVRREGRRSRGEGHGQRQVERSGKAGRCGGSAEECTVGAVGAAIEVGVPASAAASAAAAQRTDLLKQLLMMGLLALDLHFEPLWSRM